MFKIKQNTTPHSIEVDIPDVRLSSRLSLLRGREINTCISLLDLGAPEGRRRSVPPVAYHVPILAEATSALEMHVGCGPRPLDASDS